MLNRLANEFRTRKTQLTGLLIPVLYLFFLISLVLSLRAVSSISIVAIFLLEIISNKSASSALLEKKVTNLLLAACFLLFVLQVLAFSYTENMQVGWSNLRIKTGLLITPLALCVSTFITWPTMKKLLFQYCIVLVVASLYCLCIAVMHYIETHDNSQFFYHLLVKPLNQHAVYFSLLVMVGLVYNLEDILVNYPDHERLLSIIITAYLSGILLLLSSKLVIFFYLFYLGCWFIRIFQNKSVKKLVTITLLGAGLIIGTVVFATRNPISNRFYEIAEGNISIVTQQNFKEGDYFNGLQFRLLQWKFVAEILSDNKRWLTGVSAGDAQDLLNKKYLSKNMYAGEPSRGDRGYLVYNTHNQFLQTTLQNGIIGLLVLFIICLSLFKMIINKKSWLKTIIILLLFAWLFTEAPFETQYGIMIFTFFPLFIYIGENRLATS